MAESIGKAWIDVEADPDKFGASLEGLGSKAAGHGANIGKKIVGGIAAAMSAKVAIDFLGDSIAEAKEAEKVMAQTAAVITSTGGAAGVTAKHVDTLASKISGLTGVDDEAIAASENLLLTFTQIQNAGVHKIFDRATQATVDMAAALGGDAASQAIMLGKALNDPFKGISKLTKIGVTFSEQQVDQVFAMAKVNDVAGAQAIILDELAKEFGGSAEAQATASDKAAVALGNMKEAVGTALLPVIASLATVVSTTLVPAFESKLVPAIGAVVGFLQSEVVPVLVGTVLPAIGQVASYLGEQLPKAVAAVQPVLVAVGSFIADTLAPAFVTVLVPAVQGFVSIITGTLIPAIGDLVGFFARNQDALMAVGVAIAAVGVAILVTLIPAFVAWAAGAAAAAAATLLAAAPFVVIGAAVAALAYLVIHNWDTIKEATDKVWQAVWEKIGPTVKAIRDVVTDVIGGLVGWWTEHWGMIKAVAGETWDAIYRVISTQVRLAKTVIGAEIKIIQGAWDVAWSAIETVAKGVWAGITTAVETIRVVKKTITDVIGEIESGWRSKWNSMETIVTGVWDGIKKAVTSAINFVIDKINGFISLANKMQIHIPSVGVGPLRSPGFDWNGPNLTPIPHLATGGIVPGATGVAVPAVVHGGELVLNHEQQARLWSILGEGAGRSSSAAGRQYHLHLATQDPPNLLEQFRTLELLT